MLQTAVGQAAAFAPLNASGAAAATGYGPLMANPASAGANVSFAAESLTGAAFGATAAALGGGEADGAALLYIGSAAMLVHLSRVFPAGAHLSVRTVTAAGHPADLVNNRRFHFHAPNSLP